MLLPSHFIFNCPLTSCTRSVKSDEQNSLQTLTWENTLTIWVFFCPILRKSRFFFIKTILLLVINHGILTVQRQKSRKIVADSQDGRMDGYHWMNQNEYHSINHYSGPIFWKINQISRPVLILLYRVSAKILT